jgi:hypothetical protein
MPKWAKAAIAIFAAIGVAYVAMASLIGFGIIGSRCHGAIAMVVPSPTQGVFARVETQTCDQGPIETVVSLSSDRGNQMGTRSWSFFRAATAQRSKAGDFSPVPIQLNWLSDRELEVRYPKGIDVDAAEGTYNGVKVTFRELESGGH